MKIAEDIFSTSYGFWKALWEVKLPFLTAQPIFRVANTTAVVDTDTVLDEALNLVCRLFDFAQLAQ